MSNWPKQPAENNCTTMTDNPFRVVTGSEQPELIATANQNISAEWPEFMLHDPVARHFGELYEKLPDYQFVLVDEATDTTVALGNSIPLAYAGALDDLPEDGWDWAMTQGLDDLKNNRQPAILCALQIVVFGDNRGRGISSQAVKAMRAIGQAHQLNGLIAPVRPSQKPSYPLTPIEQYIRWKSDDAQYPFDAWLRVHAKAGARIIRPCPTAMRISGTIAEWQSWTGMKFPESGDYIVPGALVPVKIDCENDTGLYIEPNVWMHHPA